MAMGHPETIPLWSMSILSYTLLFSSETLAPPSVLSHAGSRAGEFLIP